MENKSLIERELLFADNFDKAKIVAKEIATSGFCPSHFMDNPMGIIVAIEAGRMLGINWLQSLQDIVPINNIPTLKGDLAKALVFNSGLCAEWKEEEIGNYPDDNFTIRITTRRKDGNEFTASFSVKEAKEAGLWDDRKTIKKKKQTGEYYEIENPSAWYRFRKRMIYYRALGYVCRNAYPDVLRGMKIYEEIEETRNEEQVHDKVIPVKEDVFNKKYEKVEVIEDVFVKEENNNKNNEVEITDDNWLLDYIEEEQCEVAAEKEEAPKQQTLLDLMNEKDKKSVDDLKNELKNRLEAMQDNDLEKYADKILPVGMNLKDLLKRKKGNYSDRRVMINIIMAMEYGDFDEFISKYFHSEEEYNNKIAKKEAAIEKEKQKAENLVLYDIEISDPPRDSVAMTDVKMLFLAKNKIRDAILQKAMKELLLPYKDVYDVAKNATVNEIKMLLNRCVELKKDEI